MELNSPFHYVTWYVVQIACFGKYLISVVLLCPFMSYVPPLKKKKEEKKNNTHMVHQSGWTPLDMLLFIWSIKGLYGVDLCKSGLELLSVYLDALLTKFLEPQTVGWGLLKELDMPTTNVLQCGIEKM